MQRCLEFVVMTLKIIGIFILDKGYKHDKDSQAAHSLWRTQQQKTSQWCPWDDWAAPGVHRVGGWVTVGRTPAFCPPWPGKKRQLAKKGPNWKKWPSEREWWLLSSLRVCEGFHSSIRFLFNMQFGHFEEEIWFQNCLHMFNDNHHAVWKHVTLSDICLVCYLPSAQRFLFSETIFFQQNMWSCFQVTNKVIHYRNYML